MPDTAFGAGFAVMSQLQDGWPHGMKSLVYPVGIS